MRIQRDGDYRVRSNLLIFVFLLASVQVAAQGPANRGELFAGIGASRVGGDEGSLGNGPYLLGGVGFRLATRASVEVDAFRAQHEREIAGGPLEGTATGVFGNVVYHFSEGRTQVFVTGSAGLLRSETTHTYPVGGTPTTFRSEENGFAWGGGGGVKIFLTPRFSLRPQFRLVFSEATGVMGLAAASIGTGYHW
ncbi:MAG TPA: outer membrane beta-barrel protein [Vicinamibacteria bacterium]|nr:outer membrane beta-barrel protein [Vicinamibacteria bacterium]